MLSLLCSLWIRFYRPGKHLAKGVVTLNDRMNLPESFTSKVQLFAFIKSDLVTLTYL